MSDQSVHVSVIDPIGPAIERIKVMLFRPFDLGRWFVIGFCAWLAYLGKQGGGPNFNWTEHRHGRTFESDLHAARDFIALNLFWLVPAAIAVTAVVLAIWLVFTWLNCRGRFMFLHCVAENKAEVKTPWTRFAQQANSLFLFEIVLGLIGFAVVGLPVILAALFFISQGPASLLLFLPGVVVFGLVVVAVIIAFAVIQLFTSDFVVPIMSLRMTTCVTAWREFLTVLSANKGRFILYILFQIVLSVVVGMMVFTMMCCTCCCACCLFAIPYVGTVALLPLFVFDRAYSLFYLRQYGPQFDVFAPAPAPATEATETPS